MNPGKREPRCAGVLCRPARCLDAFTPRGRCCPVCPRLLPSRCDQVKCKRVWCDDAFTPSGKCCPVCPTAQGPCANVRCPRVACSDAYTPRGQCCPVCPQPATCRYRGRVYDSGESWKVKCNTCSCYDGSVSCSKRACGPKPGDCPRPMGYGVCANNCYDDDECPDKLKCCSNGCGKECMDPAPPCSMVRCPSLPCTNTYTPQGECCPVCLPGCRYNGMIYFEGESVFTHSQCDECKCAYGDIRCEHKYCKPTNCDEPIQKPGDCCPECPN